MGNRNTRNGRSRHPEAPYWSLPYFMAQHPAFRALTGSAVKVLIELRCRYIVYGDGSTNNNGEITLSLDEAKRVLHMGKSTAFRALLELETAGFIVCTKKGHWYGRKASEYRQTFEGCKGQPPTKDWQNIWKQKQNSVPKRNINECDRPLSGPVT